MTISLWKFVSRLWSRSSSRYWPRSLRSSRSRMPILFLSAATFGFSAHAATHSVRDELGIPEGTFSLSKGDKDCDGDKVRLQYATVGEDLTLILGEKYIFANLNRPTFSEDTGDGAKETCVATTSTHMKPLNLESKVVQTCKNKTHNFEQSQSILWNNGILVYKLDRRQAGDRKPVVLGCEYKAVSGSKP